MPVAVEVHKLWSRTCASPNTRNFGDVTFRLQPCSRGELLVSQVFEDLDLSFVELPDQEMHLAVALEVGPTRGGVARAFDPNGGIARLETDGLLKVGGVGERSSTPEEKCREQ